MTNSVALVTNLISRYRVPCFEKLSEVLDGGLTVYSLSRDMPHRRYVVSAGVLGFKSRDLPGIALRMPPLDDRHFSDVRPVLRGGHEVVILGGWDEPAYLSLWMLCAVKKVPLVFWIESTLGDSSRGRALERMKRMLLRKSAGCIVPGRRSREYCAALGVPSEKIHTAPNAVDTAFFSQRARELGPLRQALRDEYGLVQPTILFVGRLVERYKGATTLIKAMSGLVSSGVNATLLVVGDGPDRAAYESLAGSSGADVRFCGLAEPEDLCRFYAAADILVLPSTSEVWGLVLNEGMEFGLPLVVSDAVGAGPDLVREGENGRVFTTGDAGALKGVLEALVKDPALRLRMGDASRRLVAAFSPGSWAAGVKAAIEAAAAS